GARTSVCELKHTFGCQGRWSQKPRNAHPKKLDSTIPTATAAAASAIQIRRTSPEAKKPPGCPGGIERELHIDIRPETFTVSMPPAWITSGFRPFSAPWPSPYWPEESTSASAADFP